MAGSASALGRTLAAAHHTDVEDHPLSHHSGLHLGFCRDLGGRDFGGGDLGAAQVRPMAALDRVHVERT